MNIQNVEAEQIVLGSILIDPSGASYLVEMLEETDFAAAEHREIFKVIAQSLADGGVPSPVLIGPQLQSLTIGPLTGPQYLSRLLTASLPRKQAADHVPQLKELAGRRLMLDIGAQMQEVAKQPASPILPFNAEVVNALDEIQMRLRSGRKTAKIAAEAAEGVLERLKSGGRPDIIKTGSADLDRVLGGWHRGELAILAARPSMGKSCVLFSTLRQAALQGTSAIIFSLEMRQEAVMHRLLSDAIWNSQTPVPYERMSRHDLKDYEIDRIEKAAIRMRDYAELYIDDQPALTVAEIGIRARRIKEDMARRGKRLDVIAVDHLGKITPSNRYAGNKVHETGEKTGALAVLGRELDVAVIAAHQLNRGVENRDEKRPGPADLRDSGDVEQDADTIVFLYRAAYYLERRRSDDPDEEHTRQMLLQAKKHDLEIIIAKNRNGPCCIQEVFVDMGSNAVRDRVK